MKAQDQDHINDTERMLSVISSMKEQSHYIQEKTKTRPTKTKLKRYIFNIGEDKVKSRLKNVNVKEIKEDLASGEIISLALAAYEANHAAGLVVESKCQNGDDSDNSNVGGNGDENCEGNGNGNY
ncbi:hypothetical protein Tco_0758244 [Tanacetum coccineum]